MSVALGDVRGEDSRYPELCLDPECLGTLSIVGRMEASRVNQPPTVKIQFAFLNLGSDDVARLFVLLCAPYSILS